MRSLASVVLALSLAACASAPVPDPSSLRVSPPPPDLFAVTADDAATQHETLHLNAALHDLVDDPLRCGPLVLDIVRTFVAPGTWEEDALRFDPVGSVIVARHSPGALAQVAHLVSTLARNRDRQVRASFTLLRLKAEDLRRFENIPPATRGLAGTFARGPLREALRPLLDAPHGKCIRGPRVTLVHGQSSHVGVGNQMAYIAGYTEGKGGVDPKIDVVTDGARFDLRAVANGERQNEFVAAFSAEVAALLESPPRVLSLQLGTGPVEFPGCMTARLEGRFTLRPDQAVFGIVRNPDVRDEECPVLGVMLELDWEP